MHRFLSVLIFTTLLTTPTFALDINNQNCAAGFDTITGTIKKSPLQHQTCKTVHIDTQKEKIQYIQNYQELFALLPVQYNQNFFEQYLVKKLLDNPHINAYTLTIAYLEYKDLFDTFTQAKPSFEETNTTKIYRQYGDAMISHVISGGLHLQLFHVIVNSKKAYQRIQQKLLAVTTPQKLQNTLKMIHQKHTVIVKEYFSKHLQAVSATDLNESFSQSSYFSTLVSSHPQAYKYRLRPYSLSNKDQIAISRQKLNNKINQALENIYAIHSYKYYRHHSEDFFPLDNPSRRKLISNIEQSYKRVRNLTNWQDGNNNTLAKTILQTIPKQYCAVIPYKKQLQLPTESFKISIPDFGAKIDTNMQLKIQLRSDIDIQNNGQVLRITNQLKVLHNARTITKSNKKIIYDTYVDFPGLRFNSLDRQHGTLDIDINMTRYKHYQNTKGTGIIQSSDCGYELDSNNTLFVECANIIYTPITPKFIHEEEISDKKKSDSDNTLNKIQTLLQ